MASLDTFLASLNQARDRTTTASVAIATGAASSFGLIVRDIRAIVPDPSANADARLAWLAMLWRVFVEDNPDTKTDRWVGLLVSWLGTNGPAYLTFARNQRMGVEVLPATANASLAAFGAELRDLVHTDTEMPAAPTAAHTAVEALWTAFRTERLPPHRAAMTTAIAAAAVDYLPFALSGFLVFLAGKQATAATAAGIMDRRFNALVAKYKLEDKFAEPMTGTARPAITSVVGVVDAWSAQPGYRADIVRDVAKMRGNIQTGEQGAFATTALLLEGSGLAHVQMIADFLASHPRSRLNPRLAPDILNYMSGTRAFAKLVPAEQAFVRAIYGDSLKVLRQRDMLRLFGVAFSVMKDTEPSLARFTAPQDADAERAMYDAWATTQRAIDDAEHELAVERGMPYSGPAPGDNY